MTASDQHQPASSRATAALAVTGRLRRFRNPTHLPCRRRLPSSPRARAAAKLPVSVKGPWARAEPYEYCEGTEPTKEPIVLPLNLFQSPISTANANPVNVFTPRRHDIRRTIAVNSPSAAISSIASSRRRR